MHAGAGVDEAWTPEEAAPRAVRGWLRPLLLALWLPLLLISAAAPVIGPIMLWQQGLDPDRDAELTRIGLFSSAINLKPFSDEAIASGFRPGDRIVAVDGVRLRTGAAAVSNSELLARLERSGPTVRLTTLSNDGTLHDRTLTRTADHLQVFASRSGISVATIQLLLQLVNLFANSAVIVAAILLYAKGGQRRVPLLLAFALPVLGVSFCGTPLFIALHAPELVLLLRTLGWSLLMLAVMLFPDGRFQPRWMAIVGVILALMTPVGLAGLAMGWLSFTIWIPAHTIILLIAASSLLLRYRRLPASAERQQVRWAIFGFACGVALLLAVLADEFFILPQPLPPAGQAIAMLLDVLLLTMIMVVISGGLLVSLLRYRLYDAEAIIVRSVSLGALGLTFVALFAAFEKVIELLGDRLFGQSLGLFSGGIGAAVAAALIVPLHHRLTHWAEHRFHKQLIELRRGLPALVGDLRETAPVERIAAASLDWVVRGVRASRAALVIGGRVLDARGIGIAEAEQWRERWIPSLEPGLDSARDDAAFPLRVPLEADGHGRIGWLLLGPRPDGSFYGKDERKALEEIADPVARALEIAEAREAREAADRERWHGQETLNAEIMRVLGALDEKLGRLLPE